MATLSSPGIGSGLDVNGIVTQLMAVEKQPLTALDKKEASYQAQLTAYGSLKGAIASLQTAMSGLAGTSQFQAMSAKLADTAIGTATASTTAVAGTYTLSVTQLAQAQSLAADGQTSTTSSIGAGAATTLRFQFGTISGGTLTNGQYTSASFTQDASHATGTVTIDSSNNTLQGIRDAINAANIGVTATIISDGSATPYRLVLTSANTGAASSMKIDVTGDAALQTLLGQDPAGTQNQTQTTAGQNAALTVNGLAISSTSNAVASAIQGVTLNLSKAGSTTLTVSRDSASALAAAQTFTKAYNDVQSLITKLTAYVPGGASGTLLGDSTARTIQNELRSTLTTALTGITGQYTTLSRIGISFQKDGTLALDTAKFQQSIDSNYADVAGVFAATGKATDLLLAYASATDATKPGTYAVNVTSLATQGTATGSVALGATTTINSGVNDQLDVVVDGVSATITLAAGNYTRDQLAAQIQSAINGVASYVSAGSAVNVAVNGTNALVITSSRYGSSSSVNVTGGTAQADVFGAPASTAAGVDAAGTIDGVAATGSGQYLVGTAGTAAEGLKIQILGGALGARGTVSYSQGYAYRLNALTKDLLDADGPIASRTDGVNRSIKALGSDRDKLNQRLADIEKRYRAQFTALDQLISSMQQTSTFLQQQLSNLPGSTKA